MGKPIISIVTCTFNSEKYLKGALDSIEKQTYKNIEHIFNDGYSTDSTLKIIEEYTERNKGKYPIKFYQSEPKGVANALNFAYPKATGDLIHFLHSDDYYISEDSLERVANYFVKNPKIKWITGDLQIEYKDRKFPLPVTRVLKLGTKRTLHSINLISHENTFMYTDLLEKYGGFNETVKSPVEYRLWLRMIKDHLPLVVNEVFTVFIVHPGSTSTSSALALSKGILECYDTLRKEKIIPVFGPIEEIRLMRDVKPAVKKARSMMGNIYNGKTRSNNKK
ncbi:glycosyltransferase [Patescibacteria group bacterium]